MRHQCFPATLMAEFTLSPAWEVWDKQAINAVPR